MGMVQPRQSSTGINIHPSSQNHLSSTPRNNIPYVTAIALTLILQKKDLSNKVVKVLVDHHSKRVVKLHIRHFKHTTRVCVSHSKEPSANLSRFSPRASQFIFDCNNQLFAASFHFSHTCMIRCGNRRHRRHRQLPRRPHDANVFWKREGGNRKGGGGFFELTKEVHMRAHKPLVMRTPVFSKRITAACWRSF